MKKLEKRVCPKCGKEYTEYPALSRTDNKTLICPECGMREALESFGINKDEQERMLKKMRSIENDSNK